MPDFTEEERLQSKVRMYGEESAELSREIRKLLTLVRDIWRYTAGEDEPLSDEHAAATGETFCVLNKRVKDALRIK